MAAVAVVVEVAGVLAVAAAVAVVVEVAEVSAVAVAVAAGAVVVEVSAEAAGVAAGAHQVVVPQEEVDLGASGTRAVGLRLPEAPAGAAAVVATIAAAEQDQGTGAALIVEAGRARGTRAHGRRHAVGEVTHAERNRAGGRKIVGISKASGRINGQNRKTHAQTVATSVAMM